MLKSSPIVLALARTPGIKGPRTSRLLLWFACWPFTGDLCGCVAVLAVVCVLCTAVLMWCSDVAALTCRTSWFVAVRAFDLLFDFQRSTFLFWLSSYRSCIFLELKQRTGTFLNQAPISALFFFISVYDFRFRLYWTCPKRPKYRFPACVHGTGLRHAQPSRGALPWLSVLPPPVPCPVSDLMSPVSGLLVPYPHGLRPWVQ